VTDRDFETLMTGLARTTTPQELEQHRPEFTAAWQESPQGFAGIVANAIRFAKGNAAVAYVLAEVLAGSHFKTNKSATNPKPRYHLVQVETPGSGVAPHQFRTHAEAVEYVDSLEHVAFIDGPDEHTREIYVQLEAA
jgi:hypothetical protein